MQWHRVQYLNASCSKDQTIKVGLFNFPDVIDSCLHKKTLCFSISHGHGYAANTLMRVGGAEGFKHLYQKWKDMTHSHSDKHSLL